MFVNFREGFLDDGIICRLPGIYSTKKRHGFPFLVLGDLFLGSHFFLFTDKIYSNVRHPLIVNHILRYFLVKSLWGIVVDIFPNMPSKSMARSSRRPASPKLTHRDDDSANVNGHKNLTCRFARRRIGHLLPKSAEE